MTFYTDHFRTKKCTEDDIRKGLDEKIKDEEKYKIEYNRESDFLEQAYQLLDQYNQNPPIREILKLYIHAAKHSYSLLKESIIAHLEEQIELLEFSNNEEARKYIPELLARVEEIKKIDRVDFVLLMMENPQDYLDWMRLEYLEE